MVCDLYVQIDTDSMLLYFRFSTLKGGAVFLFSHALNPHDKWIFQRSNVSTSEIGF